MNWTEVQGYFTEEDARDYRFLVSQIPDGSRMAEIGSFRGRSLASIADLIISKNLEVHSVDIFDKVESPEYIEPDVYSKREGMAVDFIKTLDVFGLKKYITTHITTSTEAAKYLHSKGDLFDLIFIDADHSYEAVKDDIMSWWPLVDNGGVLCGHDYDPKGESWPGVHKAIHELLGPPDYKKYVWAIKKRAELQIFIDPNVFNHEKD